MDYETENAETEYRDPKIPKLPFTQIQQSSNIAENITEEQRKYVGEKVVEWYDKDKKSREKWESNNEHSLKLAMQVVERKTFPWPGASNVKFPLLTIASLQFSARVYPALIKAPDLVKYRVMGKDPQGLKASRATRVSKFMSYQLLDEDETWEEQQDKLFIALPILGCIFKKTYYDPMKERSCSKLTFPDKLVIHYYAEDLERSRATELFTLYPSEIRERIARKLYVKHDVTPGKISEASASSFAAERQGITPPENDAQTPREFLESHCFWDLDGDKIDEPYIVTVDKELRLAVRIVPRFREIVSEQSIEAAQLRKQAFALQMSVPPPEMLQQVPPNQQAAVLAKVKAVLQQVEQIKRQIEYLNNLPPNIIRIVPRVHYTKYSFIPSPDGGFYDLGFGQLLGPISDTVDTIINQLIDAGTLQVGSQGFIGKGARIQGGRMEWSPFEWKRVQVSGTTLKESLVPLPVTPPSPVLFQLLGLLIQYAERIGSVSEIMSGENPGQNTPAYNMNAMLEQGLQVFNGVFKRIYRSFRSEIRKLYVLNSMYLDPETYFNTMDGEYVVLQQDFTGDPKDLVPAADPNAFSNMEKLMKSQFLAQRAMTVPGYNPVAVEKRLLEDMNIPDIDEVYPLNPDGSWAIPPSPNPETEIEKADMQRRTLEGKVRGENDSARTAADVLLKEAQAHKLMAEVSQIGAVEPGDQMKLVLEQMKAVREDRAGKIDLLMKEMDMLLKSREIELAEIEADTKRSEGDSKKQIAKNKEKQSQNANKRSSSSKS